MFTFEPASWVPYRDREVLERVRAMKRQDLDKHSNPDFHIRIVPDPTSIWIADMLLRIQRSDVENKRLVMIMPNPCPTVYETLGELINRFGINCRNVYTFNLDEWADQDGNVAPDSYQEGFNRSFIKSFYGSIDPELRMKRENCVAPTTKNIGDYSKMIAECGGGGADITYTGPGWAGHVAFVDPDTPEFACDSLEEYMKMGSRIVTLHPLTIAQNSLHGMFGCSGDIANVPPKAATVGPLDIVQARERFETHGITTMGSVSSWQRMISRLTLHAPPTPQLPTSFIQLLPTTVYVSEMIARDFDCWERVGY